MDWQLIANGDGSTLADADLDLNNNIYLLQITAPVDIDPSVVGRIDDILSFLGVPVNVQQTASNAVQVQIGG